MFGVYQLDQWHRRKIHRRLQQQQQQQPMVYQLPTVMGGALPASTSGSLTDADLLRHANSDVHVYRVYIPGCFSPVRISTTCTYIAILFHPITLHYTLITMMCRGNVEVNEREYVRYQRSNLLHIVYGD